MNVTAKRLTAFAKSRYKAYSFKNKLDEGRAESVAKILRVCDHFQNAMQNGWVNQIKPDILAILPSEEGKFKNQRADILNLLNTHT